MIETTNFKRWGLDDYFYSNPNEYRMHSDALKTIERISWKNPKTLSYNLTINDPKIFTRRLVAGVRDHGQPGVGSGRPVRVRV